MSEKPVSLKQTPFASIHRSLGARMVNFNGWEMPIHYKGVIHEHIAVRSSAGLFDVSHMGQIFVSGDDAFKFLQNIVTGDLSRIFSGKALYTPMCLTTGGIIDDLLVYRISDYNFMLCVNASNIQKDYNWLKENSTGFSVIIEDKSSETAMLALQGPDSEEVLAPVVDVDLSKMGYYEFSSGNIMGVAAIISRTGYTGEDGFELYFSEKDARAVWKAIMESGEERGKTVEPVGLAARDTLRLEMRYPLYGNDLSEDITPLEAGLKWTVGFSKESFIGRDAILKQTEEGPLKRMVGFEMVEKGIPRSGYPILKDGKQIGAVTSGTQSPSLGKGVGMGFVDAASVVDTGDFISIEIRKRSVCAKVVKGAFWKSGTRS